jgi:hypothetical protein
MKVFGGTCPMCCGDMDPLASAGAAVCLFCRYRATLEAATRAALQQPAAADGGLATRTFALPNLGVTPLTRPSRLLSAQGSSRAPSPFPIAHA